MQLTREQFEKWQQVRPANIKILFKKYKGFIGKYEALSPFNEPIIMLIRRTLKVEFKEKAKEGIYEFVHSDGEKRFIILSSAFLLTFDYGKRTFRGYICHEDWAVPLPGDPVITSELVTVHTEKTIADMKKWKAEEWKAKGDFMWKLLIGVAIIIAAYALYRMLLTNPTQAAPTATTALKNITIIKGP